MYRSYSALLRGARRSGLLQVVFGVLLGSGTVSPARLAGQSIGDRLRQKAQAKVDGITDSLADAVVDKSTGAVMCAATKPDCIKKAHAAGKNVEVVDGKGKKVSVADSAKAMANAGVAADGATARSGESAPAASQGTDDVVLVNYDFVPGDRVIFTEDFASDNIGDFPKRLGLKSGNFEVATFNGQRFLRSNSGGRVSIALPEVLPPRFTFEADFKGGWVMDVRFVDPDSTDADLANPSFSLGGGGIVNGGVNSQSDIPEKAERPIMHAALMADNKYVKAYVNGVRVANVPSANLGRGKTIVIDVVASEETPAYVSNIRVAAGGKPLYDALLADGHVATHGILFDTGSDRIRGESKPTLDLIAQMLQTHADLKLTIEGHTDNVGNAASNQTLSEKRAAAVRQALVANYHVDPSRLTSKGLGATKPAAPNTTAEGRQQNRRVELVKN